MNLIDRLQAFCWKRQLHKEFNTLKGNINTIKHPQNIVEDGFHLIMMELSLHLFIKIGMELYKKYT